MNAKRRKAIEKVREDIEALGPEFTTLETSRGEFESLQEKVGDLKDRLQELKAEEEEAWNNLGEKARENERGQAMQSAVTELDAALTSLETIVDTLGEVVTKFDEAQAEVQQVLDNIDNAIPE